jgi:predicted metalloprotease
MVRWRRLERSSNVEDRRGRGAAIAGGVGGLGIIGLLLSLFLGGGSEGGDVLGDLLGGLGGSQTQSQELPTEQETDDAGEFVSAILGTTETYWDQVFTDAGLSYEPPTLVLFTGSTPSACGGASSLHGPHYCPLDATVYIDLDFFATLQSRFGAQGGDFAEAYVIAHEVGHHVQNLLGIDDQVRGAQQSDPSGANELSVAMELQADCFAGAWANSIFQRGNVLEPGDVEEGLDAAAAVGDDRIQATSTGRIDPESWTHGSSEQRVEWFTRGYETGDPGACETFD